MFKSTRKRQTNRLNFEEQLNQQLHHLKQQIPPMSSYFNKNKQIVTIIDEVVNQLKTPSERTPKKQNHNKKSQNSNQIQEMDSLQIDENSSISLHSKEGLDDLSQHAPNFKKIQKNHISNLVSHPQVIKILVQNFSQYTQSQNIIFFEFIKKVYSFYFSMSIKEQQIFLIKNRLKSELTTTDPEYLSLNALEIIAKKHNLQKYLQSAYISMKIDQKITEYVKKNKKIIHQLAQRQDMLKERELRLSLDEQEYDKKMNALITKQKNLNNKHKQLTLKQKELKKTIEDKAIKMYETYMAQFSQKIKQTEKRLNSIQKNIKYKIEILERRSQTLKALINEKNDLKNKKIMGENEAKIKLRKLEKEIEQIQKRHQSEIEVYQKQEKDLLKCVSNLQDKLNKNQKKIKSQKERIIQLQEQLTLSSQKIEKMVQKCSDLESTLLNNAKVQSKTQEPLIKISKQKTSRSSKNQKKIKPSQSSHLLPIYQLLLQSINTSSVISHLQSQQIIQQLMKNTIKQLPQIICLLTASQDEEARTKEPHYLILNIAKIIMSEYFLLNSHLSSKIPRNSKLKSNDIQELLKYPYVVEIRLSILLLFIEIYDWSQMNSASFFIKTFQIIVEEVENNNILKSNQLKNHQLNIFTSPQCLFFLFSNFYTEVILNLQSLQKSPKSQLMISISITDLFLALIKIEQNNIFQKLSQTNLQNLLIQALLTSIEGILKAYSHHNDKNKIKNIIRTILFESIELIEQFAEKISILIQRYYYKYSNLVKIMPQIKKIKNIHDKLHELNLSNGNRHSLIQANMKSILSMIKDSE